jgi:glucose-6-phosphate-specific signal transduction histidine kinase
LKATLAESIQDLVDEIQAITSVKISLTTDLDEKLLNESIKLMVYRIVQEQINNILKHASASQVEIKIGTDPNKLDLVITDNGLGLM